MDLVTRLETIERQALLGWQEAASQRMPPGYDWRLERVGDALCSVSASEPNILLNRVLGLGSEGPPTRAQLDEIRAVYRSAGVSRFFLHVLPEIAGPDVEELLAASGYRRYRGWMKFTWGGDEVAEVRTDLSVRAMKRREASVFAAIVAPAFGLRPASEPVVAAVADDPGTHLFMTFDGERPAGAGGVFIRGENAYLEWGATRPDFRERGSQSALLAARIRAALDAGCTSIVTMTGEAVPGDPQHSYRNILRMGFREAYLRQNWLPADG